MYPTAHKILLSVAFSLAIVAISLTGLAGAATAPALTVLSPLAEGMRSPLGITQDSAGSVYVADPQAGGVLKYNAYGRLAQKIRTARPAQGVAVAIDGTILVSQGTYVARYNQDGEEVGRLGNGAGEFKLANGIALDSAGFIYVVDSLDNCVKVYTAAGGYSTKFGTFGSANGQFSTPTGIAHEKTSNQLAVVDTRNGRIQFFDIFGVYQKSIGTPGTNQLQFGTPQGVTFEYSNDPTPVLKRMYVVDTFQSNVQVIDPAGAGTFLSYIGGYGVTIGQLLVPSALTFDQTNSRLLVVNGSGVVNSYGIDGGVNPSKTWPPALTIDPVISPVYTDSQTITGTVEAGATVSVIAGNGVVIGSVTKPSATTWSVTVNMLASGDNVITVTAKDEAWNMTTATASIAYLLPAPALSVNPLVTITNIAAQTVTGTTESGATVAVTNAATGVTGNATVNGATWEYPTALEAGLNTFIVTAQKAKSAIASAVVSVTLDASAPVISVSSLPDKSYTSEQVQNISLNVADPNLDKVTINGQPITLTSGAYSTALSLVLGANAINVAAVDLAGNVAVDNRIIYFDNIRPVVTIDSPTDNTYTSTAVISVSGSVDQAATVTVNGVAGIMSGNQWSAVVALDAGMNTIDINATDLAGNSTNVKRTVIFDTAKPEVAITLPAQDLSTNLSTVVISGTVSDPSPVTVTADVNGVAIPVKVDNGYYSFPANLAADGAYAVTVKCVDSAGNSTSAVRTIIYDTIKPKLTVNAAKTPTPAKLDGTVEAGAVVSVEDKNGPVKTASVAGGLWSADLANLAFDLNSLVVKATDAAGNSTVQPLSIIVADGDLNGDGVVTGADAVIALKIFVKQIIPTATQLAHGDIGPLVNGKVHPNGKFDLIDATLIMRRAAGLPSW